MIRARAPGKVVLWGEYAVLAGAPALVMAVDRYAQCTLEPAESDWRFTAAGHDAREEHIARRRLLDRTPPPDGAVWSLFWHGLQALDGASLPAGGHGHFDTGEFHRQGIKLGIGSSAALGVAIYGALCRLLGQAADIQTALDVHRRLQGGAGSGIDVAAAWHGGLQRFRRGAAPQPPEVEAWQMPGHVNMVFVWSGRAARTTDHLERLRCWLGRGYGEELGALAAQANALFEAADPLPALRDYVALLASLDKAAQLGIYGPGHQRLARLAFDAGVVYKPCGAGGGDIGAAFTADPDAATRFHRAAAGEGFLPLALETASHGLEVTG